MTLITLEPSARRTPGLVISLSSEGPAAVVALLGEADVASLRDIKKMLDRAIRAHDGPIVIDLAGTRFIDSGTVRVLGECRRALGAGGRQLTIRSPSRTTARVLEIFGISDAITPGGDEGA